MTAGEPLAIVVEDSPANAELLAYLLHELGWRVMLAHDVDRALVLVDSAHPALVFTDLRMPGLDGYELLRRIRENPALADVDVVAVTAAAGPGYRDFLIHEGFRGYLAKPIDPAALTDEVERHLKRRAAGWP